MTTLTVTATQGGSTANGMLLHVFVLTGALASASQTGNNNSTQFSSTGTWTGTITNSAGSNIYLTANINSSSATVTGTSMTIVDNVVDGTNARRYITGHAISLTAGTTTRGFTVNASLSGPFVMQEILASGTLAEDGSAPAVVSTTAATTLTTASFTPPPGSLLVALVTANGAAAVETMTVSGGSLSWTEKVKNDPSGGRYSGIWLADVPLTSGSVQQRSTVPIPRRVPARALARIIPRPGTIPPNGTVQSRATIQPRRVPARAYVKIIPRPGTIPPSGTLQPRATVPVPRKQPARAYIKLIPVPATFPVPPGPPPIVPTSGGDRDVALRVFRELRPGDIPATGARLPRLEGRAMIVPVKTDAEHVTHAWDAEALAPDPGPGLLDRLADARDQTAAATGRVVELGRIFADPPYQRHPKTCGAIRKIGGVMLTCKRKTGHGGKHTDRGLDWG